MSKQQVSEIRLTEKAVTLSNGVTLTAPPDVTLEGLVVEVFHYGAYAPGEQFQISPGDTVFDIGANVGVFAVWAALHDPSVKVYAFEPASENFRHLQRNIEANGLDNIVPLQCAVSDSDGELTLYLHEHGAMHTMFKDVADGLHRSQAVDLGGETVPAWSLDSLLDKYEVERCDFLKIDCEGAEYAIFDGLSDQGWSRIAKISAEYHNYGEHRGEDLQRTMRDNGFVTSALYPSEGEPWGGLWAMSKALRAASGDAQG